MGRVWFRNLSEVGKAYPIDRSKPDFFPRSGVRWILDLEEVDSESFPHVLMFRPGTVVGKLVNEDGRVPLNARASPGEHPEIASEVDSQGRFLLSGVPHGHPAVVFERNGEPVGVEHVAVSGAGERVDLGTVALEPRGRVSGVVVDLAGNPIADALISVKRSPRGNRARNPVNNDGQPVYPVLARSDDAGAFRLAGLPVGTSIGLSATGHRLVARQTVLTLGGTERFVTFTLPRLADLTIRVVSARDNELLREVAVLIDPGIPNELRDGFGHAVVRQPSPTTGEIRVGVFPGGQGRYEVMLDGYVEQREEVGFEKIQKASRW